MPRNTSGTYTLPAGNPVVTATTISTTWANTTLGDLATEISDSASRSGKGGFTAPVRTPDGTAAAPGVAFTAEPASGLYRAAANDVRLAVGGVDFLSKAAVTFSGANAGGDAVLSIAVADSRVAIQGNKNAGSGASSDVVVGSAVARTAGYLLLVDNPLGVASKLRVDYQGLLTLASQAAPIQPASIWTAATLSAGWTGSVSYFKDACGVVHIKGSVTNSSGGLSSATMLILPVGFRVPASGRVFSCSVGSGTPVGVIVSQLGDGAIAPTVGIANGGSVYLDSVSFLAES